MGFDSLIRTRQVNKPEFSGYIVDVFLQYLSSGIISGLATNTGHFTGEFYPYKTNPSGYLTPVNLSGLATSGYVNDRETAIKAYADNAFYLDTNPSGYIDSGALTGMATVTGDFHILGAGNVVVTGIGGNIYISGTNDGLLSGYFDESRGLSLPYVLFHDTGTRDGDFLFAPNSGWYLLKGVNDSAPSQDVFIDLYGRSAATFLLNYTKPTIKGFDFIGDAISSSGYRVLTTNDSGQFASVSQLVTASGELYDEIYRIKTEVEGIIETGQAVHTTGNQTVSGIKTFVDPTVFGDLTLNTGSYLIYHSKFSVDAGGAFRFDGSAANPITSDGDGNLTANGLSVGANAVVTTNQTGSFITTSQTGLFYPRTNPSGYITSGQTGVFIVTGQTGSFITTGQTGLFYPRINPSGFVTSSQTGQFYPRSGNPSGFVLSTQTGSFVTTGSIIKFSGELTSGIDMQTITYPLVLPTKPTISCEMENNIDNFIYSYALSSITTSNFVINFSDTLSASGYVLYTTLNL